MSADSVENTEPPAATVVSTLLGHRQMSFGPRCLDSLVQASAAPVRLRIFDDGTLTESDAELLRTRPGSEIVWRSAADERTHDLLARHPRAREFRRSNPLGLKLLDVAMWSEDVVRYCDADILFLRPYCGLWNEPPKGSVFMQDVENAYSIGGRHLLRHEGLELMAQVNTGIIVSETRLWDLDRIEWFLALPRLAPGVWVEQTCWAMLAAGGECRLLDPRQFAIPMPGWKTSGEEIALHFVSPIRDRMGEWPPQAVGAGDSAPLRIRTHVASRLGLPGLMRTRVARRLRRLLNGG